MPGPGAASFPVIDVPISRNNMNCYDAVITVQAEPVFGDVTGDAVVAVDDLLAVINSWGECSTSACNADVAPPFAGEGVVDVSDLLFVIKHWS